MNDCCHGEDYRCEGSESLVMVVMDVVAMVNNKRVCSSYGNKDSFSRLFFDRSSFVNKSYFSNLGLREASS